MNYKLKVFLCSIFCLLGTYTIFMQADDSAIARVSKLMNEVGSSSVGKYGVGVVGAGLVLASLYNMDHHLSVFGNITGKVVNTISYFTKDKPWMRSFFRYTLPPVGLYLGYKLIQKAREE